MLNLNQDLDIFLTSQQWTDVDYSKIKLSPTWTWIAINRQPSICICQSGMIKSCVTQDHPIPSLPGKIVSKCQGMKINGS